jgi:hypothetical protein
LRVRDVAYPDRTAFLGDYFRKAVTRPELWIAASRRTMSALRSAIVAFDRS